MSAQSPRRNWEDDVPPAATPQSRPALSGPAHSGAPPTSRRRLFQTLTTLGLSLAPAAAQQDPTVPQQRRRDGIGNPDEDEDPRLPNGKSQKDAIAQSEHEKALKEADSLAALANQLKDDLQKAGNYTVPVSAVKKTEEIEKLARRIRGRLQN